MASNVNFGGKIIDYGIQTSGGALIGTAAQLLGYAKNSLGVSAGIGAGFFFVTEVVADLSEKIIKNKNTIAEAVRYRLGGIAASVLFLGASYAIPMLYISPLEALALTVASFALKQLRKCLSTEDGYKITNIGNNIGTSTTTTTTTTTATTVIKTD